MQAAKHDWCARRNSSRSFFNNNRDAGETDDVYTMKVRGTDVRRLMQTLFDGVVDVLLQRGGYCEFCDPLLYAARTLSFKTGLCFRKLEAFS